MKTVKNQFGRYVFGEARDLIIAAYERDDTTVLCDGTVIEIVKVSKEENGDTVITVEVHFSEGEENDG